MTSAIDQRRERSAVMSAVDSSLNGVQPVVSSNSICTVTRSALGIVGNHCATGAVGSSTPSSTSWYPRASRTAWLLVPRLNDPVVENGVPSTLVPDDSKMSSRPGMRTATDTPVGDPSAPQQSHCSAPGCIDVSMIAWTWSARSSGALVAGGSVSAGTVAERVGVGRNSGGRVGGRRVGRRGLGCGDRRCSTVVVGPTRRQRTQRHHRQHGDAALPTVVGRWTGC